MDQYEYLGRIGEGAHGIVFKARHINSGEIVALKKIPLRKLEDGIPNQALREIKALQEIDDCPFVVRLRDVFPHGTGFVLVFDYMVSDLSEVIRNSENPLSESHIKSYMLMLLKGVAYFHDKNVMHRDLKPANLLIANDGRLKIADFGLARLFEPTGERLYSHQVATRWYRAPELLYGARKYDKGVDLWAIGAIFGELLNSSPLFPGSSDIEQLSYVLKVLGTPKDWPGVQDLPDYNKINFPEYKPTPWDQILPDASCSAIDLLKQFLVYDSTKRIHAHEALLHPYFFTEPLPAHHSVLPIFQRMSRKFPPFQTNHYEYSADVTLEEILPDPELLRPFINNVGNSTANNNSSHNQGIESLTSTGLSSGLSSGIRRKF